MIPVRENSEVVIIYPDICVCTYLLSVDLCIYVLAFIYLFISLFMHLCIFMFTYLFVIIDL